MRHHQAQSQGQHRQHPPARGHRGRRASELPGRRARTLAALRHRRWLARPEVSAGRDISWPQCPPDLGVRGAHGFGGPLPGPYVRFVVIGLTNGRSFTRNPCLDRHLRWARGHHAWTAAYAMSTFPTREQVLRHGATGPYPRHGRRGRLANAAWAAARFNIATLRRQRFATPQVWLDIEPTSVRPWHRRADNRVVVRAWVRAYRSAGYGVGFYSTPYLWHALLGGLRLGLPEWRTAGPASARAARGKCSTDRFQGGPGVLAQWWSTSRDFDRMCPGYQRDGAMVRYFHRY